MTDIKNQPCPFCGSEDISDGEVLTDRPNGGAATQSMCRGCGALGPEAMLPEGEVDYGDVRAIEAWNRRPAERTTSPVSQMTDEQKGEPEAHKLARILWNMVEAVEDYKPSEIYRDGYQSADGDVFVHRAATVLVEQAAEIAELVRYVDDFGSRLAAAAPHAQAPAAPVAEPSVTPEMQAKVDEIAATARRSGERLAALREKYGIAAQPQPVAEQGNETADPQPTYAEWRKVVSLLQKIISTMRTGPAIELALQCLDSLDAWSDKVAASQQAAEPKRQVFIDEIDAAKAGSAWMEPFFLPGFRLCYSQDEGAQAPQVKWCMLFDSLDRVIAGYMLTRDAKNWTELTLVGRSAAAIQQPQDERAAFQAALVRIRDLGEIQMCECDQMVEIARTALAKAGGVAQRPNADCSGDPKSCPDNEGCGCACDPMNKAGKEQS